MTMQRPNRHAFTLIELLVVIAIIALLISILLPAMSGARKLAQTLREQASGNQNISAWTQYANDNKEAVFMGYLPWSAAHFNSGTAITPYVWIHPDPWHKGYFTEGNAIKVNGLRWMGESRMPLEAFQLDKKLAQDFGSRGLIVTQTFAGSPPTKEYSGAGTDMAAAVSYHPSLGMNTTGIGGSWSRGAYLNWSKGANYKLGHPKKVYYVTHLHQVNVPTQLIQFASSRARDIKSVGSYSGYGSYGRAAAPWAGNATVIPGFWDVHPPRGGYQANGSNIGPSGNNFWATTPYKEDGNPHHWGYVHPRHGVKKGVGQAVTVMVDGHVEMQTVEQLRDMRKWGNGATKPDWNFPAN